MREQQRFSSASGVYTQRDISAALSEHAASDVTKFATTDLTPPSPKPLDDTPVGFDPSSDPEGNVWTVEWSSGYVGGDVYTNSYDDPGNYENAGSPYTMPELADAVTSNPTYTAIGTDLNNGDATAAWNTIGQLDSSLKATYIPVADQGSVPAGSFDDAAGQQEITNDLGKLLQDHNFELGVAGVGLGAWSAIEGIAENNPRLFLGGLAQAGAGLSSIDTALQGIPPLSDNAAEYLNSILTGVTMTLTDIAPKIGASVEPAGHAFIPASAGSDPIPASAYSGNGINYLTETYSTRAHGFVSIVGHT